MLDLQEYFKNEHQFYLDSINYKVIQHGEISSEIKLNCSDTVKADLVNESQLNVTFLRSLFFDPSNLFELNVSYGALLTFKDEIVTNPELKNINFADELINSNSSILNNLASRASLQIAQITSSAGQIPIITPPRISENK